MKPRSLNVRPEPLGTRLHFHADEFAIERVQDVEPYLKANHAERMSGADGHMSSAREMRHVARVPLVVLEYLINEKGIDYRNRNHLPALKRWLNDPENKMWRTIDGHIG